MILTAVILILSTAIATQAQTRMPSHCLAFADLGPPVHLAGSNDAILKNEVLISYVDHSMYMLDTHGGLRVVTDYNGFIGLVDQAPDVITMNKGHSSHYTDFPDPVIPHILRGWDLKGGVADHHLELGEMLIRNVTTDIRSDFTGRVPDGNSIFIFEVGGMCIGHLGHLHHEPTDAQYARIGRLDVVMAAVDGGLTLDTPAMLRVMKRLKATVVLPMHWFGGGSLADFLGGMQKDFEVVRLKDSTFKMSLDLLPARPTVMVVPPRFVAEFE
ncbi:MAG: MBL fold metallo-hydrolase [Rhodobacteraceae bacterium]|nr:MBL fold metallo-hydrolase [Paracoccaceae bacterium]